MEARVGGTNVGQKWRVTGLTVDDTPGMVARVQMEFYVEYEMKNGLTGYERLMPNTLDPALARELGQHLIEMANHAEETS
jgi:hypothetical protein